MCVHLPFNYKKATQMLNYFAVKSGGKINKLKALKLVFFADRYHLRKYGRPITNDEYFAMDYGPVASGVKDIAEMDAYSCGNAAASYSSDFIVPSGRYSVSSKKVPDETVLSESDLESMAFAWETFGHYSKYDLADLTHLYPEWKRHEKSLQSLSRVRMSLEDFFEDPTADVPKCFELSEEEKVGLKEQLEELSQIERLWK